MNRAARRALASKAGKPMSQATDVERAALKLTPEKARELLARWAAERGRSQAEIDAMNGRGPDV